MFQRRLFHKFDIKKKLCINKIHINRQYNTNRNLKKYLDNLNDHDLRYYFLVQYIKENNFIYKEAI